mgnify:CR=1 FL=1
MRKAVILEPSDIKKLIAEKYEISVEKVKSTGYSYFVELENIPEESEHDKLKLSHI